MLTRQGWLVAILALGLATVGRVLSVFEITALGLGTGMLVFASAIWVGTRQMKVKVLRRLQPTRVQAGTPSTVTATISNTGNRRSPVMYLHDRIGQDKSAVRCEIMPIPTNDNVRVVYRIPTSQRGIIAIGPMTLAVRDPFGLASVRNRIFGVSELTVLPLIDRILPPPSSLGHDPHGGLENPDALGRVGDEFYALRQYQIGDDLRRVHWPSSAKRDEMMVRQDEQPWQGRSTVLLDLRSNHQVDASFELCVSAAASIISAAFERGDLVRLTTTDGGDSRFGTGHTHIDAILEYLATVQTSRQGTLQSSLGFLQKASNGGALVVVTSEVPVHELGEFRKMQQTFGSVHIVSFTKSSWDTDTNPTVRPTEPGLLQVTRANPFVELWNATMRSGAPRAEKSFL